MSLKALIVTVALGILTWPSASHAEKATTNQDTKVFSRAGEQSTVILKVEAGQQMTVLAKDGRWIKVRVSGRTGWVPRTKLDLPPEEDDVARNTRRRPFVDGRSTKRGFGGEAGPDDRVGADAVGEGAEPASGKSGKPATKPKNEDGDGDGGDDKVAKTGKPKPGNKSGTGDKTAKGETSGKPGDGDADGGSDPDGDGDGDTDGDDKTAQGDDGDKTGPRARATVDKATTAFAKPSTTSAKKFTVQPRTALFLGEETGKWTQVENNEGDEGYVLTASLRLDRKDAVADGGRRRMLNVRARVGASFISQGLKSTGGEANPPDNYTAQSPSLAAAVGASALFPFGQRWWAGIEVGYDFNKAVPGVEYMDSTTSFTYHSINARLGVGYDLQSQRGTVVMARVGMHYDGFQVPNVADYTKNTVRMPNQNIMGPTVGLAMIVPRMSRKVAFTASVDALVVGASVSQTKNLEDGIDPDAKAVYLGLGLGYHLTPKMDFHVTYDLGYTAVSFGGPPPPTSQRQHSGTNISGTDLSNILSFGILYGF
ncbi:MAG: SH3 domain-containing protein [Myxococcales bacterium]|nr:SH3 domain-containing protein [Myxococcales bacterium]